MSALNRGWECVGIRDGYNGLMTPEEYPDGGVIPLGRESVRGITHLGGTILGTTNRGNPLSYPMVAENGQLQEVDRSDELIAAFAGQGIGALVTVGGDGSMRIAHALAEKGLRLVGVPKTIDNDLEGTTVTFGFNTAVYFATECIDRLHSTAQAHRRVMVVEVMGRYAGWIALHAGLAGSADVILIPEIPYDIDRVVEKVLEREQHRRHFTIVVVAEGARPAGGGYTARKAATGGVERLGGVGLKVAEEIEALTGKETRAVVLGHLQRGGKPTSRDRILALRFGAAAVRALAEGQTDVMVALDPPDVRYVPLVEATRRIKTVPLDGDVVRTARELGMSLGD
jgi:6-phosphofructokinase 1